MISLAADGTLRLAPSDLAAHLACPHLTQLAAALQHEEIPPPPERENAQAELIARKGDEHEAAFLATLREQGREVVEIGFGDEGLSAAAQRTEEALRAGVEVAYQGVLSSGGWRGLADFLIRIEAPSELGSFSYEAWDTKLARHAKPNAVLQLTFYSHELERIQGRLPERMHAHPPARQPHDSHVGAQLLDVERCVGAKQKGSTSTARSFSTPGWSRSTRTSSTKRRSTRAASFSLIASSRSGRSQIRGPERSGRRLTTW